MKKFVCKLLAAILLLGALTGVLTACKKDTSPEPDQYAVRMDFSIWSMWPEVTDAHRYTLYTRCNYQIKLRRGRLPAYTRIVDKC